MPPTGSDSCKEEWDKLESKLDEAEVAERKLKEAIEDLRLELKSDEGNRLMAECESVKRIGQLLDVSGSLGSSVKDPWALLSAAGQLIQLIADVTIGDAARGILADAQRGRLENLNSKIKTATMDLENQSKKCEEPFDKWQECVQAHEPRTLSFKLHIEGNLDILGVQINCSIRHSACIPLVSVREPLKDYVGNRDLKRKFTGNGEVSLSIERYGMQMSIPGFPITVSNEEVKTSGSMEMHVVCIQGSRASMSDPLQVGFRFSGTQKLIYSSTVTVLGREISSTNEGDMLKSIYSVCVKLFPKRYLDRCLVYLPAQAGPPHRWVYKLDNVPISYEGASLLASVEVLAEH